MMFSESAEANLGAWLEMDARRGHQRSTATLEEYGMTTEAVERDVRRLHRALRRVLVDPPEKELDKWSSRQGEHRRRRRRDSQEWREYADLIAPLGERCAEMFPDQMEDPQLREEMLRFVYSELGAGYMQLAFGNPHHPDSLPVLEPAVQQPRDDQPRRHLLHDAGRRRRRLPDVGLPQQPEARRHPARRQRRVRPRRDARGRDVRARRSATSSSTT